MDKLPLMSTYRDVECYGGELPCLLTELWNVMVDELQLMSTYSAVECYGGELPLMPTYRAVECYGG